MPLRAKLTVWIGQINCEFGGLRGAEWVKMGVRGVKNHVFGPMGGCSGPMTFILGQDEIYT